MMSSPTLHFSSRIESNRCHGNNFGDNIRQSQQKSNKQFNKIRQFIASKSQTSEICTEKMGTRTIDQHKINETSPVFHNSIHNDSFNNQERAEYDKLIAELQATLVKERMEHNIFLKEMAELLAETKCDSEYEDQLEISANDFNGRIQEENDNFNTVSASIGATRPNDRRQQLTPNGQMQQQRMVDSAICFLKLAASLLACV